MGNVNDNITLRTSIPIGNTGIIPALSAAYAHIRPATEELGVFGAGFRQWIADGIAGFTHPKLRQFSLNLRGQLAWKQPLDNPIAATFRYTITAGIGYAYPGQIEHAAAVQMRVAPAYTPTPTLSSDPSLFGTEDPMKFTSRGADPPGAGRRRARHRRSPLTALERPLTRGGRAGRRDRPRGADRRGRSRGAGQDRGDLAHALGADARADAGEARAQLVLAEHLLRGVAQLGQAVGVEHRAPRRAEGADLRAHLGERHAERRVHLGLEQAQLSARGAR